MHSTMTTEQKQCWDNFINSAKAGATTESQDVLVPLDLLLMVDLEICALEALCGFRTRPSHPPKNGILADLNQILTNYGVVPGNTKSLAGKR